jgi:hypothetical protein
MSHDYLIGSTIITRSQKSVTYPSKISSPSVILHDTKTSKVSEKDNPHDFCLKNFNHTFLLKTKLQRYRNNEFDENQNHIGE